MTLVPGTLVAYDRDPRYVAAFSLYVVVGEAKPDTMGRRQVSIQCVDTMPVNSPTSRAWKPFAAAISELTPLDAFGFGIASLTQVTFENGHSNYRLKVQFDPISPVTAKRSWGNSGALRDDKSTVIRTVSLFNLIKKAMIAGYRDARKAAA